MHSPFRRRKHRPSFGQPRIELEFKGNEVRVRDQIEAARHVTNDLSCDEFGFALNAATIQVLERRRSNRRGTHWNNSAAATRQPGTPGSAWAKSPGRKTATGTRESPRYEAMIVRLGVDIPDDQSSRLEVVGPLRLPSRLRPQGHNRSRSEPRPRKRESPRRTASCSWPGDHRDNSKRRARRIDDHLSTGGGAQTRSHPPGRIQRRTPARAAEGQPRSRKRSRTGRNRSPLDG